MHSPEWVLPGRHSAKRLYTSSVPPMRVYGLTKQRRAVTRVTRKTSTIGCERIQVPLRTRRVQRMFILEKKALHTPCEWDGE